MWLCIEAQKVIHFYLFVSEHGNSDLARRLLVFAGADDFVPLPPVLAKEVPVVKNPWDDEDAEEQLKEEEKPKPVRGLLKL